MGGIFGVYYFDGQSAKPEVLQQMSDTLAHRGSDGADIWYQNNVGLGHRLLWTTPESLLEKQPLTDEHGNCVITADARIDNRDELISRLDLKGLDAEKLTDVEIILKAYHKWGEQCPQELLGDFAFAIWDRRKQQLFCARDHFGVKSFYYYSSEDQIFTFASEIKAIFTLSEIPQVINEERIGDYLIGNFDDLAMTSYQEIFRLPPGSFMTVTSEEINIEPYWSLDPTKETRFDSDEEYAARFLEIFTEAVRCRLRTHSNIGSMLSGGLDSSSITCVARKLLPEEQQLATFSAIFDRISECDERQYINTVINEGNYQPHYLHGDRRTPFTDINRIFEHEDEAFFAPGFAVMTWGICKLAHDQKISVLLHGQDGDSTVSHGIGYLDELAKAGRWIKLFREIRGVAKVDNENAWLGFWNYFYGYGLSRTKPIKRWRRIKQKLQKTFNAEKDALRSTEYNFNLDFVKRIGLEQREQQFKKIENISRQSSKTEHYRSLTQGLHPFALETFDKAAAAFSLELRYPFWDKRLVEFCLSLPPEQKLSQGWSRVVMRHAMKDFLPPEIQWRTGKINFLPNLIYGLLTQEKQALEQLVFQDTEILSNYINTDVLQTIYERVLSDKFETDPEDVQFIWKASSLGLWLDFIVHNRSFPATALTKSLQQIK
jgi:asparagine synthase (glutamine-hydrolysing)